MPAMKDSVMAPGVPSRAGLPDPRSTDTNTMFPAPRLAAVTPGADPRLPDVDQIFSGIPSRCMWPIDRFWS